MAISPMKWMILTESIHDYIEKKNWLNLSLEQREMLIKGLESDIAAAKKLSEKAPLAEQQILVREIAGAESSLAGLTAIHVPPHSTGA